MTVTSKDKGDILLSIVIVNYNGHRFIRRCLDSIFASEFSSYEVIVVDNHSQDDSLSLLSTYKDRIRLIVNQENLGFSKANNQGFKHCLGEFVLLLNNDTIVSPLAFKKMVDYLKAHDQVGALSPRLLNPDGSIQTQGSVLGAWQFKSSRIRSVSFICGAAILTRKKVLDQIGGLDENLYFYNEDIDFCKQVKKLGYQIIYYPDSEVVHFGGLSTATRKADSIVDGYRGGLYIVYKTCFS